MTTVAIYARVSTEKQDEQLQIPTLERYAADRGWEIFKEYSDVASGKDSNRPGWRQLMADAAEGHFEIVLATKLDRIMRSVTYLETTMSNFKTYGVRLVCLNIGEIDPRSSMGHFTMHLFASMAEWERETISERTREALAARKARGQRLGRTPREDIDYRRAAELRRSGASWRAIARELNVPLSTIYDESHRARILELSGSD